jgi:hypothetical protein
MPVIQLGKNTKREAVCVVFEKVNTGGKKLDAFELLTAIYAGGEEGFMLRERWASCVKRLSDSIALRDHPITRLQATEFFQALALLHTLDLRKTHHATGESGEAPPISCTRDTVLKIPLNAYKKHAERLEEGFRKAGRFLFSQHIYWFKDVPTSHRSCLSPRYWRRSETDRISTRFVQIWHNGIGVAYLASSTAVQSRLDLPEI